MEEVMMTKVRASQKERLIILKKRIMSVLLSREIDSATEEDLQKILQSTTINDVKSAVQELIAEGRLEVVP
jgi:hypothetical protein